MKITENTWEEQYTAEAAKELAAEMDFGILKDLCSFEYEFNFKDHRGPMTFNLDPSYLENWCENNCKEGFIHYKGIRWCFKSERDLNWFKLRWL